ncbi:hypothetical protein T4B_1704 [Trichinella pseudospiralis]|uniref:Uncharacterized protein n=1 Tax=Trichinella pseudospiralis TaxID=6337 RepID=A0A0V1IK33_TRIPS|nr:hypothetical protein T4B_1704 [Trichinella pseudospiralis]
MNMSRCEQRRSIGNDQAAECYHYPLNRCVKLKRNAFKCAQAANELSYCNNKPDTAVSLHNCVMAMKNCSVTIVLSIFEVLKRFANQANFIPYDDIVRLKKFNNSSTVNRELTIRILAFAEWVSFAIDYITIVKRPQALSRQVNIVKYMKWRQLSLPTCT